MERGDTRYHTVVTVFEPDTMRNGMEYDYAEELLSNSDNIQLEIVRGQSARSATGEKHPNTSSKLPSEAILAQDVDGVKKFAENSDKTFSLSDSEGAKLSPEQSEYFKDSKIVDKNGNLLKVYHTTNNDFKLKQELLNRGYNIAEYDPEVEGDRTRVVNQFEEYMFSLSDAGIPKAIREMATGGKYYTEYME